MSEGVTLATPLQTARAQTDALFKLLVPGAIYDRPIPERHRLVFYLGHLEAFDWNQIGRFSLGFPSFHPEFDKLFELGIDPPPGQAPQDQPDDWPSVAEVDNYNRRVRARIDEALDHAPPHMVQMVIEHRHMHAETFAYLLHQLPHDRKEAVSSEAPSIKLPFSAGEFVDIPAGSADLGQTPGEFGWDNEFDAHSVSVPAFSISKYKVTNGEYLEFVLQGGAKAPHFWVQNGGQWLYHGMFADTVLPLDHPVWLTHDEASAYARWRGMSLPTEAQFDRAAYGSPAGNTRPYPWGHEEPAAVHGNFDSHAFDPISVLANPQGDSAFGVSQSIGNGWEWTRTPFAPFDGFVPHPSYPTYSQNFFDGEHFVIKGGSPRTAAGLLRRSFRNWFRPNYPYVYAGFHLVAN